MPLLTAELVDYQKKERIHVEGWIQVLGRLSSRMLMVVIQFDGTGPAQRVLFSSHHASEPITLSLH